MLRVADCTTLMNRAVDPKIRVEPAIWETADRTPDAGEVWM